MHFSRGIGAAFIFLFSFLYAGADPSEGSGERGAGPPFAESVNRSQDGSGILEDIRRIEFSEIRYDVLSDDYFGYIKGKIPVLISAPHGARHYRGRENRWKGEDEYTASLAIKLGQLTGAHVIYVRNKTKEDPNNDFRCRYKDEVTKIVKQYDIQFLLDLHGADGNRPFKVDVGVLNASPVTNSCPTFKETIRAAFSGFESEPFNKRFSANGNGTMTWFARNELGIEAAQVEINARYRVVERKPDSGKARKGVNPVFRAEKKNVLELVARLETIIHGINRKIRERSRENTAGTVGLIISSAPGVPHPCRERLSERS